MSTVISFGVLGPLWVIGDTVTAGRDRVVLAMLLLHADRVLGPGTLIEAVWGEQPPSTARAQLQTCVSRLRRALPAAAIVTDPAGYRFRCAPDELDASVFARLATRARERRDRELFRQALDLWRGPALAEIDSLAVRQAAAAWDERRAVATEEWIELELAAGQTRELLGELAVLAERFPLRERLRGQLMTALWRSGRQADALAEYRRARQMLADELGLEPGPELQELHRQMLAGEGSAPSSPTASSVVRCLPRTVGDFTGREAVVDRLVGVIDRAVAHAPVVAMVDGMAGSGKTTLALHVASLVGDHYPDAHLFVDLHGHSSEQPVEPAAALLILLRQLGVPADQIPASPVERVSRWRTELAGRRALVLLDNAASSAQLADLLPAASGSLALVTSRRRLLGLDGVHPESLGVLGEPEAVALLTRIVGDRVQAEPAAAVEVVRRCGGLPLALRLAGSRLAHRPRWRVAELVRRLGVTPLPELAAESRSVAAAFELSFGNLAEPAQRMFRLLGLYPGATFDGLGVAALTGLPLDDARDLLDDLVDVHLVEEPAQDAYRMHDLLREFAGVLAAELPAELRREALAGALDLQLHAIAAASPPNTREMTYRDIGRPEPMRPDLLTAVPDPARWFERERPHLSAFVEAAAEAGLPEYGWWLPRAAWWSLFHRGYFQEVTTLFERAMSIVESTGDRAGIAAVANYLASGYSRAADFRRARELLELCIRLREELGQRDTLISALSNLAVIYDRMGRYTDAVEAALRSRRMAALTGDQIRGRPALTYLANAYLRLGRYDEALHTGRLNFLYAIDVGDDSRLANALQGIVRIRLRQGSITIETARRQLDLLRRFTVRRHLVPIEGEAHNDLATLFRREGRYTEAMAEHRDALAIAGRIGDTLFEAEFLNEFAHTCRAAGDQAHALELHRKARRIAESAGLAFDAARAEAGVAECLVGTDPEAARRSWTTALAEFREMGVPERFAVERRLADLAERVGVHS